MAALLPRSPLPPAHRSFFPLPTAFEKADPPHALRSPNVSLFRGTIRTPGQRVSVVTAGPSSPILAATHARHAEPPKPVTTPKPITKSRSRLAEATSS